MDEKLVLALVRENYLCGAQLGSWVRSVGCGYERVATSGELLRALNAARPDLVVVDLALCADEPAAVVREGGAAKLVAFGPPGDPERRRAAEAAGFDEVLLGINYHRSVPQLLRRHIPDLPEPKPRQERGMKYAWGIDDGGYDEDEGQPERNGHAGRWRSLWSRRRREES